jgi:hypothetical protein
MTRQTPLPYRMALVALVNANEVIIVCCLLVAFIFMLPTVRYLLPVVCCPMSKTCCLPPAVCYLLSAACCSLFAVCSHNRPFHRTH